MDTSKSRAKKNTCTIYERSGMLCIRFKFKGQLIRKSLGLPDTDAHRLKATEIASKIELSILTDAFDLDKLDDFLFNKPEPGIAEKPKRKKYPQYPKNSPKRAAFTAEESNLIIKAFETNQFCSPHSAYKHDLYAPIVKFILYTACRIDEATALQFQDIEVSRNLIHIRRAYGKGERGQTSSKFRREKQPKTQAGIRQIPLTNQLRDLLQSIVRGGDTDLVFPSPKGKILDHNNFRRVWKQVINGLGIPYRVPRAMRKTRITHLIEAGVPINQVSFIAGHANSKITLDTYTSNRMPKELPDI